MEDDDEICLCFHVTKRKVERFIRQQHPRCASQIGEYLGAGTGCGWCRPFLETLHQRATEADSGAEGSAAGGPLEPTASEYAEGRRRYRHQESDGPEMT